MSVGSSLLVSLSLSLSLPSPISHRQVWRPINTVYKDPLAVADAQSVADADLVEARVIYRDHERRTWTVKPSPSGRHRWYYKAAQTPDEVMLIKCFDSVADGSVSRRTPHSAFHDAAHEGGAPRESIEIRALVFYADDAKQAD